MLNLHVLNLLFLLFTLTKSQNGELLSIVTLHRHGARGPIMMYQNDPYRKIADEIWPEGFEQLTNIGKNQQYELGQWLRQHYKDFIPQKYSQNFIRILSSNADRCLMSASANLAGLFPPKYNQIWNKNLLWQPIPIHTTPQENDNLIVGSKPCPKHSKLTDNLKKGKFYKTFFDTRANLTKYIAKNTGEKVTNESDVMIIHDTLFVESFKNLELPEWTKSVFPEKTLPYLILAMKLPALTPQLARLRTGPLIDHITTFFDNVLQKVKDSPKYLMLSAHDTTMIALLTALELYDDTWLEYASIIMIELRMLKDVPFLNLYFRNSTHFERLVLDNCGFNCRFTEFKKLTKRLRISQKQWDKECNE